MIGDIHLKLGIAKLDKELEQMKEPIIISELKENVEQGIEDKNNTIGIT